MGLHGKLVAATEFQPGGDVFHELFALKPHYVPTASTDVHSFDHLEGELGKPGCIVRWTYTHDGKVRTAKEEFLVDDEKKIIELKVLEGDLMEVYKDFLITFHVENKKGKDLVTWTLEYESINEEEVAHPISLLEYFIKLTKDIESHHLNLSEGS